MYFKKSSLRNRIFIAMIFLVVIASVLIAAITIYQYNEQAEEYHSNRLERKEEAIKSAIFYELNRDTLVPLKSIFLPRLLDEKLNEISDIHNLDINIYDLKGNLLRSSHAIFSNEKVNTKLSKEILTKLEDNPDHRMVLSTIYSDEIKFKSSYSFIINAKLKRIGIIGVPYLQDNTLQDKELREFLLRLMLVYILILVIAIIMAYFLSKVITKPIEYVSHKMRQTALDKTNKKIILNESSYEIRSLVTAYNTMIDQLEESAVKLAQIERVHAWREMAKQVAHEIKNPLTPMRLTIQSFEHKFDPTDPNIKLKLKELSMSLIQQIDTMSSIASAFSNFANMPSQKKEKLNVISEVKLALDIFHEDYIEYRHEKDEVIAKLDKIQLTRVVTNLITNAIQALTENEDPKIIVTVKDSFKYIIINVLDNGTGIPYKDKSKIFEPKFTTKSSGMGLGLPMVKNIVEAYGGEITFESTVGTGTLFTVSFPKI